MSTSPTPEAVPHLPQADTFEWRGAYQAMRRAAVGHRWVIFLTMVLTVGLVATYIWIWPPTFQAEVMIAADSDKDVSRTSFYQGWNIFRREALADEGTLMISPPVLKAVVERLDLRYEDMYHPFTSYVTHLWGQSWVGQNYRIVKAWILGTPPKKYELSPEELERYKVMSDFSAGVAVRQVGEANIGLLIVKGSNERCAEIANEIVKVYFEQRRERYVQEAEQSYASLWKEADKTHAELAQLDREIKEFRSATDTVFLFEKDRVQIGQWLTLRSAVTELQSQIADQESTLAVLDIQLRGEAPRLLSDRVFKDDATKERLLKLELGLAALRQQFQPDAPEVRDVEQQISAAMADLADNRQPVVVRNSQRAGDAYEILRNKRLATESLLAGTRAALKVKQDELALVRTTLDRIPAKMQLNQEFERRQRTLETKSAGLNDKLTLASVSMATARSAPPAMRVVEGASVPEKPIWPNTKLLIASAAAGGLVLGLFGALLLDLVFLRANRWRLGRTESPHRLFAIVDRDDRFVERLYSGPSRDT